MEKDKTLSFIVAALVERLSPDKVVLFGSRARGDFHATSDYDVAVFGRFDDGKWALTSNWIQEKKPSIHKVDLVRMESCDPDLTKQVEKEGIALYTKAK